ncbi:MAG: substrate-binding domain-containing protein, partial [Terriglobia bacterium]
PAVKKRIEEGEPADVVIVQPDFAGELTESGKVRAGDLPIIGHVGVGVGNREDSLAYDISTVEKLKSTLLSADLLVFNSVKSGQAFAKVLERLGIAETLKPRIVRTTPSGIFEPVLHLPTRYSRRVHQVLDVTEGKGDFRSKRRQVN